MNGLSRRDFLGATGKGLATAGVMGSVLFPRVAPAQAIGANEKVRVGLIGAGGMGRGDLDCFLQNPEVDCPIICDVDDAMLAKCVELVESRRGHKPDTVKDFRRVIDRKDVDVVLVGTPDHWHALPTVFACQAGKDVYVEKPLGRTIDEGRAMLEAMKQNKRVVQMGTQWHSAPHYTAAIDYVHSGKLGKVRMVRAWAYLDWLGGIGHKPDAEPPAGVDYDMWLGPAPERPFNPNRFHFNFRWFWDYAGGLMTDWGVHLLNICLWGMGLETPLRVSSVGGKRALDDDSETPDTQATIYDFPSYVLIFEHQIQGGIGPNKKPHGMLFSGTEGTLTIDSDGWVVEPEPKKNTIEAETHEPGNDGRPAHVRNFLDCVKSREMPTENLEIAHHVSTVAHLGNLAFRSQAEVHWDAENERVLDNPKADAMVAEPYRAPWKLPYARRTQTIG